METPYTYWGPSGIEAPQIGNPIVAGSTITPTHRVHHITGTGTISVINAPWADFVGPIILVADEAFSWDDSGNITVGLSPAVVGEAYPFYFDRQKSKWYPRIATAAPTTGTITGKTYLDSIGPAFIEPGVEVTIPALSLNATPFPTGIFGNFTFLNVPAGAVSLLGQKAGLIDGAGVGVVVAGETTVIDIMLTTPV